MKQEDKQDSIKYWDEHAHLWEGKAYDKDKQYLNFPVSQQRQDITVEAVEKMAKDKSASIIDFGCADGELVIDLLKRGFTNIKGIDNSSEMIETAKEKMRKEVSDLNPDKVFFVADADDFDEAEKFDFVIAMGLIEYLLDIDGFFGKLKRILKPNGCAFIESRNKLFNLFSANEHTVRSSMSELTEELKDVARFSPINQKDEVEKIAAKTFSLVPENLKDIGGGETKKFEKFPFDLPQFTPKEIESFCHKQELKLENVVYYHYHSFLPKFEKEFPIVFNRLALLMQPLGYTPLGATNCSAFIALIKPNNN